MHILNCLDALMCLDVLRGGYYVFNTRPSVWQYISEGNGTRPSGTSIGNIANLSGSLSLAEEWMKA